MEIPVPSSLLEITWAIIGFMLARAFGKRLDQDIQKQEWFKKQNGVIQNVICRLLDFTHHFWVGLLLMVYFSHITEIYYFGYGLFIDDSPDIIPRLKKIFSYLRNTVDP